MFGIASRLGIAEPLIRLQLQLKRLLGWHARFAEVGFGPQGKTCFEAIREACRAEGLPLFYSGLEDLSGPQIHVRAEDAARLLRLLSETLRKLGMIDHKPFVIGRSNVFLRENGRLSRLAWLCTPKTSGATSLQLLVEEYSSGPARGALRYVSTIEINVWSSLPHYSDESLYSCGTPFSFACRIRKQTLDQLAITGATLDEDPTRDLYEPDFAVDAVYTWVDDSDPDWLERKEFYARKLDKADNGSGRSEHRGRFRSRDELRYSLRSLEIFAPWLRQIYIVTADQKPSWLNTNHPKITLVSHRDIFKNPRDLPNFNSSAIESQLHHVEGLSPHFLYFNDDFFLGQLCRVTDFFCANGLLKFFPSTQRVYEHDVDETREEYLVADKNAVELFKRDFGFFARPIMLHVPYPSSRELLNEMEQRYAGEFDRCTAQRFRSPQDLRPVSFMQSHYGFFRQRALPASISHSYLALWRPTIEAQLQEVRDTRIYQTLCINDVGLIPEREGRVNRAVADFLRSYFPKPSAFELSEAG